RRGDPDGERPAGFRRHQHLGARGTQGEGPALVGLADCRRAPRGERAPDDHLVLLAHACARAQRYDLALASGREHPAARSREQLVGERRLQFAHTRAERRDLIFQLQDATDAFQVQPLGRQSRDLAKLHDIPHRVAARLAGRALRAHETEPVVLAKRLRMHAGQLRRDGDREEGRRLVHHPRAFAMSSSRGFSAGSNAANSSSFFFASPERWLGTTMCTVASRSPVDFAVATPRPFTRSTRPLGVPGATRKRTGAPSSVGTSIVAPRAASVKVTGTSTRRLAPSRSNTGCGRTAIVSTRSPGSPPSGLGCPLPRSLIFWPSLTPAGIFTLVALPPGSCNVTVSPWIAVMKSSVVVAVMSAPGVGPPKPR